MNRFNIEQKRAKTNTDERRLTQVNKNDQKRTKRGQDLKVLRLK
jgi:hypothetical protein